MLSPTTPLPAGRTVFRAMLPVPSSVRPSTSTCNSDTPFLLALVSSLPPCLAQSKPFHYASRLIFLEEAILQQCLSFMTYFKWGPRCALLIHSPSLPCAWSLLFDRSQALSGPSIHRVRLVLGSSCLHGCVPVPT